MGTIKIDINNCPFIVLGDYFPIGRSCAFSHIAFLLIIKTY